MTANSRASDKAKINSLIKRYIPGFYLNNIPESDMNLIIDVMSYGLSLVSGDITDITKLYNIDEIDVEFLPYLAYLVGYVYDFRFTDNAFLSNERVLRNQLKQAVAWMKLKGTALGIKQFLLSLGVNSDVKELWYNSDYDDVIPSESVVSQINDEIFKTEFSNNSIQFLYNNGVIDSSEINELISEFITGSFVHSNIVNGSIVCKIQQFDGTNWITKTRLVQDNDNNFIYDSFSNIPVNLGTAKAVSSKKSNVVITSAINTMSIKVDGGAEQVFTLTTSGQERGLGSIANEINNKTTGLVSFLDNGYLVIKSNSNSPDASIEIVDISNSIYNTIGLDVGVYPALTRTYFDPQTEFLVIELLDPENFSESSGRVLVSYEFTEYMQPSSISSFDYKTGAKSNWFDIDMTASNENFILTADTVVKMVETVKNEIKPFHALLRQVNFSSLIQDELPETTDEITGDIDGEFIDRFAQCCLRRDNCIKFIHDGAVPNRSESIIVRDNGCLPKGILMTRNGFIAQRDLYTIYNHNLTEYSRWPYNNNGDTERNYVFRDGLVYNGRVYHRDYCNYPKIIGYNYENFEIDDTNNKLLISLTGFGTYDITLTNGTWNAERIADMINSVTLSNYIITYLVHQLVQTDEIIVDTYLGDVERTLAEVNETSVSSDGTVELEFSSNDTGLIVLASTSVHAEEFTSVTQATVTPAQHGFGTTEDLHVYVYDDSTPRKKIKTQNININSGTVTVDFDTAQSGQILVRSNSNSKGTFTSQTSISLTSADHGLTSDELIIQLYDSNNDMILPLDVIVDLDGNIEVTFNEAETGYWVVSQADWSTAFNTSPNQGLFAMGLGGFVRLIGKTEFNTLTKTVGHLTLEDVSNDAYEVLGFATTDVQNTVCPEIYNNPPTELETSTITKEEVFTYVYDENNSKIFQNELSISPTGIISLDFETAQRGKLLLAGNFEYSNTFSVSASPFLVSVPSAIHALGATDELAVQIIDDSSPRKIILPKDVEIASNGDVTVYFEEAQDGKIIIRNPDNKYAKEFTSTDNIIIPRSEHLISGDLSVYVYDDSLQRRQVIPNSISLSASNDVIIGLDEVMSGKVVIHGDWEFSYAFDSSTGTVNIIPGVTGQIYLGYSRTETDELLLTVT